MDPKHTLDTYPFKTRPFAHQYATLDNSWMRKNFALHLEMGLGKSRITIDTLGMLWLNDRVTHALVIAPAGVYRNWIKEFDKHLPDMVQINLHAWNKMTSKKEQAEFKELMEDESGAMQILLMNVEALSSAKGVKYAKEFLSKIPGPSAMVIDESSTIKNRTARRTKSAIALGKLADYRRVLSGLPTPNSPMDLFAPFQFLSGNEVNLLRFNNFYAFTGKYAIQKTVRLGSQRQFQTIVGYKNLDDLNSRVDEHAARLTKAECLDLPEKIYTTRECEMTGEQKRLYNSLKQEALTELQGCTVAPKNAITKLLRLQQLVCGHIGTDEGDVLEVDTSRMQCLLDTIEETTGKVVVWAHFRHTIQAIQAALAKAYGKESVESFYGDTPSKARVEINTRFQDPSSKLRFFVGNPSVAGYGLDLTASSTCIYFSRDFRLDTRLQSEDRLHRIGQTVPVTYVDIVTKDTLDSHVTAALRSKLNLSAKVLGEKAPQWV